jgi:starch-binding outer membrane protein, SusD/RagB family
MLKKNDMRNNKYLQILILSSIALFSDSCSKQLNQVNPNQQTSASFWLDENDAIKGINAAYSTLIEDGTFMRMTPALTDARGDDVHSNSPWPVLGNMGRFSLGTGDPGGYGWAFSDYYEGVNRANQVLDNVPNIVMDTDLKNRILGQAYFLRGLYFFYLVDLFNNVALPLHAATTPADFFVPQSPATDGWNQVISDFTQAVGLLPVSYVNTGALDDGNVGRATKGAAMAYLGKALLFNNKFPEAADQFKAVIDLNAYSLVANYADNFGENSTNNSESIFEVQFSRNVGGSDASWGGEPQPGWGKTEGRAVTYGARGFGFTDMQPTLSSLAEFQTEKDAAGNDDPRLDVTMFHNKPGLKLYGQLFTVVYANSPNDLNDVFTAKYENGGGAYPDEFSLIWRSAINQRLMRYADVLLMYAECLNEQGQTTEAYPYIQQVRSRVGMKDLAVVRPNMTQQEMRDQLAHERYVEFSFEGHRFDDIHRWGWLTDPAKLADLKARDPEFNNFVPGREFYPIPQSEIDNNPGFTQNQSY